jgi:hypothetical protein
MTDEESLYIAQLDDIFAEIRESECPVCCDKHNLCVTCVCCRQLLCKNCVYTTLHHNLARCPLCKTNWAPFNLSDVVIAPSTSHDPNEDEQVKAELWSKWKQLLVNILTSSESSMDLDLDD